MRVLTTAPALACRYYHLPAVHPALCNVSGVDEHMRRQGKGMYMCFVTTPLNGESTAGATPIDPGRLPPFAGLRGDNLQTAWHICLFPNVFFSLCVPALHARPACKCSSRRPLMLADGTRAPRPAACSLRPAACGM